MRITSLSALAALLGGVALAAAPVRTVAQQTPPLLALAAVPFPAALPDAPVPVPDATPDAAAGSGPQEASAAEQKPTWMDRMTANARTVPAGEKPPPPSLGQSFRLATESSFSYPSLALTGLTSLIAEGADTHSQLGKGVPGFWAYSWRGFVDKTDGNYWVLFLLPTVLRQDERYYALERGGIWKRGIYASSRVLITPDYHGRNTLNTSELVGRGIAEGISTTYYPSEDRSAGALATKWAFAILRDAGTNTFREFWPGIAARLLHRNSR
ncbi:MAG TPA: hypothetical protein VFI20_10805 [Terracidiphilus sp.]|nr:hypothetical protein [Terracidiphilus sp.]